MSDANNPPDGIAGAPRGSAIADPVNSANVVDASSQTLADSGTANEAAIILPGPQLPGTAQSDAALAHNRRLADELVELFGQFELRGRIIQDLSSRADQAGIDVIQLNEEGDNLRRRALTADTRYENMLARNQRQFVYMNRQNYHHLTTVEIESISDSNRVLQELIDTQRQLVECYERQMSMAGATVVGGTMPADTTTLASSANSVVQGETVAVAAALHTVWDGENPATNVIDREQD